MATSDVYVTIGIDQQGNIVEVRAGGRVIEPKESPPGAISVGGSLPGCPQVIKRVQHELLTCGKEGADLSGATRSTSIPCCFRDPITGRIWCWC